MGSEFEGPFFLFLGAADREGVTSKLVTAGIAFQRKQLESSLANWATIQEMLHDEHLAGTLAKFTNRTFAIMCHDPHYDEVPALFEAIAKKPHIVFVHESFFTGKHTFVDDYLEPGEDRSWEEEAFGTITDDVRSEMLRLMQAADLNIITYTRNAELSVIASEFVDASARHLLFRIYMPNSRIWAGEVEKILQLFRDYLNRVSGLSVRQEQSSTRHGVVYEFFGDHTLSPTTLPQQFEQFSRLMDECVTDPEAARQTLSQLNVDERVVVDIVERYSKEARRLQIDLKHERERKLLSIRHRLEAELVDEIGSSNELTIVEQFVDMIVPRVNVVSPAAVLGAPSTPAASITVNVRPQIISTVNGIVAQEISGTQNFGPEPAQLLELITLHAGANAPELTSAVYELEDTDGKAETRITARQKLKSFLFKLGDKVSDVALGLLQSYIERKVGL
jgi:hypothetical protein